ncbi:MAG: tRNA-binding protein [Siphonobacter sp.]
MSKLISWQHFVEVELRVGTIVRVQDFPKARKPAYQLWIDFGPELGEKCSSAQITSLYTKEELLGRQIIAVTNFPVRQIANFFSEVLVTGFPDAEGNIVLSQPDRLVPNGTRLA